jgi:hypothetical protein
MQGAAHGAGRAFLKPARYFRRYVLIFKFFRMLYFFIELFVLLFYLLIFF